eukprot:TRINITY_DN537_c0_g1_i3.p1 TRINITY_DN537_c0_g1~~TRINITY_DN537_c0_g1_i3.p1  ORF type:complete len:198 (+),score=35.93 TRINITY_DN537_c0_g1_i3:367-960(+)
MGQDGNCLFRSVADQVYGDQEMHETVRRMCMDYMDKERDHFSQFVTEDFNGYIARKRKDKCFGNNLEMQALAELFNRPIEVYSEDQPLNIFHSSYKTDNPPIRLSYHHGNHYNSIRDPNNCAILVGLGLPDLESGGPEKVSMKKAIKESEANEIEQKLLQQFSQASDMEATEQELENAIIEASMKTFCDEYFGVRKT